VNCAPDLRREPSFAQVLSNALAAFGLKLHTSCPGVIISYDAQKQVADVQPQVQQPKLQDDSTVVFETPPVIPNVPVEFPGGGGFRITWPVQSGDPCILDFQECPIDAWLQNGGSVNPEDLSRFEWHNAVCRMGVRTNNAVWKGLAQRGINVGVDGGPQIVLTSSGVELGAQESDPAIEPVIKGQTFSTAVDTLGGAWDTWLGAVETWVAALTAYAQAIKAIADPTNAATPVLVAANGVLATAAGTMISAIATFESGVTNALSGTVKTK